jgi:hypothetical protein
MPLYFEVLNILNVIAGSVLHAIGYALNQLFKTDMYLSVRCSYLEGYRAVT